MNEASLKDILGDETFDAAMEILELKVGEAVAQLREELKAARDERDEAGENAMHHAKEVKELTVANHELTVALRHAETNLKVISGQCTEALRWASKALNRTVPLR
jgi:hypothetical protein